jgi:hypothetical protein
MSNSSFVYSAYFDELEASIIARLSLIDSFKPSTPGQGYVRFRRSQSLNSDKRLLDLRALGWHRWISLGSQEVCLCGLIRQAWMVDASLEAPGHRRPLRSSHDALRR